MPDVDPTRIPGDTQPVHLERQLGLSLGEIKQLSIIKFMLSFIWHVLAKPPKINDLEVGPRLLIYGFGHV